MNEIISVDIGTKIQNCIWKKLKPEKRSNTIIHIIAV